MTASHSALDFLKAGMERSGERIGIKNGILSNNIAIIFALSARYSPMFSASPTFGSPDGAILNPYVREYKDAPTALISKESLNHNSNVLSYMIHVCLWCLP